MEQRVSLVTIGVGDLARSRAFYEALGWSAAPSPAEDVVFFQAGGQVVGLWGRDELAADMGVEPGAAAGAVGLAHNVGSPEEVDRVLAEAERAGATVTRGGAPTFWGGYSGVFLDPDGHPWEVAHNPFWELGPDGAVRLPGLPGG